MSEPMTSQSAFLFPDPTSSSTQQATFTSFSPGQTYITSEPITNSQLNPQTSNNFLNQQFQQYHTATISKWEHQEELKKGFKRRDYHSSSYDAREIWLAVKARFGGNEEFKKMRKTMLKQEFSEFSVKPDNDDVNLKFLKELPPSWSQVALTLKTRGGLEYLSFDDLYNKLRSLEIDVNVVSSYGSRGTTVAPTDSAFIGAASTNTKMVYSDQPSYSSSITYTSPHSGGSVGDGRIGHQMADGYALTKDQQNEHEVENKTEEGEQVYGLMAEFKLDFADHAGNAAGSVYDAATKFAMMRISPKEWEVKLVESLARTKLGLGFKEYNGSDEVFDLSTPSVFDPELENKEVKSLYKRFVKAGEMHEVPIPITGTFMPTSYKFDLEETQVTFGSKSNTSSINTSESNAFVSCDNSDKSLESATYDFASCVSSLKTNDSFHTVNVKILPKSDVKDPSPTNGFPSCSFKENVKPPRHLCNKSGIADRIPCKNNFVHTKTCFVCGSKSHLIKDCDVYDNVDNFPSVASKAASIPAASINRPASIHAGRNIPAGRFNKLAPFSAGRFVPTGWTNHAARPFFRTTNLYFDNVSWPGIFNHMSMNEGRWGFAVKSSAENQLNIKVKAIRCDNGTEFRIAKLIDLYEEKGIKRDYSNARTPQQNRVAKRKNRTLIEAARSMLADSKLPTMFWTEVVSTTCYVLNRVSITNPYNKTPYELLSRKVPNIRHLKPFGCQVTILNTSDHLGKFEGKANEGFLVGYAANSYTRFKSNTPASTQDTNINAGPKVNPVSATMENHLDYVEEHASLQRQEHEAHSVAAKYGFEFSNETEEMLHQAEIKTRRNLVLAAGDPTGSIVSTGGVPASSVHAGSVSARSIPTGSVPASSVPAGGVLAGSVDSASFGDHAISESVPSVFNPDHADNSTLLPGHSLGSSEHSTRFSSLSDLGNHQPTDGICGGPLRNGSLAPI
nr:ribonuclease H-like domain-containing protein [Tanacetum cinerariifolium]